jgi:transposase-like protein
MSKRQEFSLPEIAMRCSTEADAYLLLEELRWGGKPDACPHCGGMERIYFLNPQDGTDTRKTRTGSRSARRVWKCGHCRKQFSVLTGTIFHGTRIPIHKWLMVIFEFAAAKNSISAWEISRKYKITNESAWHMLHRIREAMKMEPVAGLLGGAVQVDESWLGGNPKNRHANDPREIARKPKARGVGSSDKQPIVALVHYESRSVRAKVVPDVTGETLLPAISEVMDVKRTHLHTDGHSGYKAIAPMFAAHEYVDHRQGEYTRGNVSTNLVEGWFSQLKRSLDGTHHAVSVEHLDRYLTQFAFMYSFCRDTDSVRMRRIIDNVEGRRLPYKPLTDR